MKNGIYTVHDVKAHAYLPPFVLPTNEMAIRTMTDCVNDKGHNFGAHPEDYTLFLIGEWDNVTGKVEDLDKISLGNGLDFIVVKSHIEDPENTEG